MPGSGRIIQRLRLKKRRGASAPAYDWTTEDGDTLWLRGDTGVGAGSWTGRDPPAAAVFSEATNPPTFAASAVGGKPGFDFDGTNDRLGSESFTIANAFGAASSAYCSIAVVGIDAVSALDRLDHLSNGVWANNGTYVGMYLARSTITGVRSVIAHHFDGTAHRAATQTIGTSDPAAVVLHTRFSGGLLYAGVNGIEGTGVAAGSISAGGNALLLQIGKSNDGAAAPFFNGKVAELMFKANGAYPTAAFPALMATYGI